MKKRIFALLAAMLLLTACSARQVEQKLDAMEDTIENKVDQVEQKVEQAVETVTTPDPIVPVLTKEDAEAIALEHAGLTADQVAGLRTKYEIDDGVPEYEVDFHVDRTEYEYTIHAETGEVLSFDMDN